VDSKYNMRAQLSGGGGGWESLSQKTKKSNMKLVSVGGEEPQTSTHVPHKGKKGLLRRAEQDWGNLFTDELFDTNRKKKKKKNIVERTVEGLYLRFLGKKKKNMRTPPLPNVWCRKPNSKVGK
jgi:hypothetical protein